MVKIVQNTGIDKQANAGHADKFGVLKHHVG